MFELKSDFVLPMLRAYFYRVRAGSRRPKRSAGESSRIYIYEDLRIR